MASLPVREPTADHLLTPQNSALLLIDYQPPQVFTVRSMETGQLVNNVVSLAKTAKVFGLPIILSTVNVASGLNPDTIPQLREALPDQTEIDRTSINSWEDEQFLEAVKATGRKKLIMAALWTEACLLFPTLDAIKDGYEVYPVVDAVGGTTRESHEAALKRCYQAGAQPTTWNSLHCELQRDWARTNTVQGFRDVVLEQGNAWGWYLTLEAEVKKAYAGPAGP
ncbi:hydrolase [Microtetraspora fusca]|uniref:Hydrolase n=1 Tax=Microtetraspora fusca TaxID=1997 RepID=A0ABW6VJK8_MICFU